MIVIGYTVADGTWGHRYRRVTDPDQQLAVRRLTDKAHVPWKHIEAFAELNVFFTWDGSEGTEFAHLQERGFDGGTH